MNFQAASVWEKHEIHQPFLEYPFLAYAVGDGDGNRAIGCVLPRQKAPPRDEMKMSFVAAAAPLTGLRGAALHIRFPWGARKRYVVRRLHQHAAKRLEPYRGSVGQQYAMYYMEKSRFRGRARSHDGVHVQVSTEPPPLVYVPVTVDAVMWDFVKERELCHGEANTRRRNHELLVAELLCLRPFARLSELPDAREVFVLGLNTRAVLTKKLLLGECKVPARKCVPCVEASGRNDADLVVFQALLVDAQACVDVSDVGCPVLVKRAADGGHALLGFVVRYGRYDAAAATGVGRSPTTTAAAASSGTYVVLGWNAQHC